MVDLSVVNAMIDTLVKNYCSDGSMITGMHFWERTEEPLTGTIYLEAQLTIPGACIKHAIITRLPKDL